MGLKLGKQTPLQRAAEQIRVWQAKFELLDDQVGSVEWRRVDRQLDEWYTKAIDLQNIAKGAGQRL